tara:strand:+ start:566 stop:742 length:177 start_codon:yes stop_codon:yes gene_type:complete
MRQNGLYDIAFEDAIAMKGSARGCNAVLFRDEPLQKTQRIFLISRALGGFLTTTVGKS